MEGLAADPPIYVTASIIATAAFGALAIPALFARAGRSSGLPTGYAAPLAVSLVAWLIVTVALASAGVYQPRPGQLPATLIVLLVAVVGIGIGLRLLPGLGGVLRRPAAQPALIGLQVWRIEGLALLVLWAQGSLPAVFALPAGMGDVAIGLSALVLARHTERHGLLVAWNVMGLVILVTAVTLVVTASPGALHVFDPTPPVSPMTAFPLAIIPTFLIPISNALHITSLRFHLASKGRRDEWTTE
jgi:hypothetical protein